MMAGELALTEPRGMARGRGAPCDRQTLAAWYDVHATNVGRWAARLGGPGLDVDDVVQEVFLTAQRDAHRYDPRQSLERWLHGITVHAVLHQRRRQRWPEWWKVLWGWPVASEAPASPHTHLEASREAREVYQVLDGLSERDRAVLVLFELEGASGEDIAALLGVRVSAVWVRLHRARARFRAAWERRQAAMERGDR